MAKNYDDIAYHAELCNTQSDLGLHIAIATYCSEAKKEKHEGSFALRSVLLCCWHTCSGQWPRAHTTDGLELMEPLPLRHRRGHREKDCRCIHS